MEGDGRKRPRKDPKPHIVGHPDDPGGTGSGADDQHTPGQRGRDSGRPAEERSGRGVRPAGTCELIGVSDDLVYELTERGDLPCLRLGRRKVIPRQAIDGIIERPVEGYLDMNVTS